jgi:hypothetical protein
MAPGVGQEREARPDDHDGASVAYSRRVIKDLFDK